MNSIEIILYADGTHRSQVMSLWEAVFGHEAAHNTPGLVIDKKMAMKDGLFFVAVASGAIVGTVMAGYDGHRGWIYSVAVAASERRSGIGSRLVKVAEGALRERGCVKVNLQVGEGNEAVTGFYEALGFSVEQRVSMGKLLGH